MKIQNNKTKTATTIVMTMMLGLMLLSSTDLIPYARATNTATCSAGSGPKGDRMDGTSSNVWIGSSGNNDLDYSSTSSTTSCSVSANTAQNDPTNIAFAGNGDLVFTQKTQGSCISSYDTSTRTILWSNCSSGAGADDVDADSSNSNDVWSSWYYGGYIGHFVTNTGSLSTYTPPSCGVTSELEGLRVDSSGNVWVADEACGVLWKYVPSSNTWTSNTIANGLTPWWLAVDSSNGQIWITSTNNISYALGDFNISTGTSSTIKYQGSAQGGSEVAVDPTNRVFVAFQNGYVNDYYSSLGSWGCTSSGDSYPNSTPFGISYTQTTGGPDYYWSTLYGTNQLAVGHC